MIQDVVSLSFHHAEIGDGAGGRGGGRQPRIFLVAAPAAPVSSEYSSETPIVVAAILYFLVLWPLVRLLSRLENRALSAAR